MLARLVRVEDDGAVVGVEGAAVSVDEMKERGLSGREIRELAEKLAAPERPDFELDVSTMRDAEEVGREMAEAVPDAVD